MLPDNKRRKPSISLTPLIDVVFILLIFFMLVMQFKRFQQETMTLLTQSKTASDDNEKPEIHWLTLIENNQCRSADEQVSACIELAQSLTTSSSTLVLNYQSDLSLEEILTNYQQLNTAGFSVLLGKANVTP